MLLCNVCCINRMSRVGSYARKPRRHLCNSVFTYVSRTDACWLDQKYLVDHSRWKHTGGKYFSQTSPHAPSTVVTACLRSFFLQYFLYIVEKYKVLAKWSAWSAFNSIVYVCRELMVVWWAMSWGAHRITIVTDCEVWPVSNMCLGVQFGGTFCGRYIWVAWISSWWSSVLENLIVAKLNKFPRPKLLSPLRKCRSNTQPDEYVPWYYPNTLFKFS